MSDITTLMMAAAGVGGAEETDPNFNQTVLLLHGDGTNGAQNNTFVDSSTNNFTVTRNGNTTQGTFSPFSAPDGRWSNYFGAATSRLTTTGMTQLGSDFTLEVWIYPTSFNDFNTIFDNRTSDGDASGIVLGLNAAAKVYFYTNLGFALTTTGTVSLNSWTHISLVRSGGGSDNVKIYINGTADATTATNTTSFTRTAPSIGCDWNNRSNLQYYGYLSNLRATNAALYTTTFTPSTNPLTTSVSSGTCLLLTCQSNRFVDNSASTLPITVVGTPKVTPFSPFAPTAAYSASVNGGSGYFDGTGDNLTTSAVTALTLGTGSFCIEYWHYVSSFAATSGRMSWGAAGSPNIYIDTSGKATYTNYATSVIIAATTACQANAWNHIVICRNSSNTTTAVFVNGVREGQVTNDTNNWSNGSGTLSIASGQAAGDYGPGTFAGLRIVKGDYVYDPTSTTLTIPTAPPTNITNTSLLLNFTNAGIFDNTGKNVLETVGNAQIDTTTKKYGTGSLEFDGTGDYLVFPDSENFNFGKGPFSIEFWAYCETARPAEYHTFTETRTGSASTDGFGFGINNSDKAYFYMNGFVATDPDVLPLDQWVFLSAIGNGAADGSRNVKLYVNGTLKATWTTDYNFTSGKLRVGTDVDGGTDDYQGFIDDLRITKNIARDGTVVPTKEFPNL